MSIKFLFALFLIATSAQATELFEPNRSVRALGMGNAYAAVVRDADSIFYNPAGIAKFGGFKWTILSVQAGINGLDAVENIADLQGADSFGDALQDMYGEPIWAGVNGKTAFIMPYFAFAIYDSLDASLVLDNPAYPVFQANVINDYGFAAGVAVPILPIMHVGMVVKKIFRTGSRVPIDSSLLATLDPDLIQESIQKSGSAYSMDLGINLLIPTPIMPTVSFVWRDVGVTKFKPKVEGDEAPPADQDNMILGVGLTVDTPLVSILPSFEVGYLNRSDVQLGKKINLGVELDLPVVDVRAGFHQGYLSYGAGIGLGLINVEIASYGVELGEYPGQQEDRRYMLEFSIDLGFDGGMSLFGGSSGGKGGKGGSSGGGSGSRLKRRR